MLYSVETTKDNRLGQTIAAWQTSYNDKDLLAFLDNAGNLCNKQDKEYSYFAVLRAQNDDEIEMLGEDHMVFALSLSWHRARHQETMCRLASMLGVLHGIGKDFESFFDYSIDNTVIEC